MSAQVSHAVKKARSGTYAIHLAKNKFDLKSSRIIYDTLVVSHLGYCDILLSQADVTCLNRLQVAQNKAIRAVCIAHPRASADQLLANTERLSLESSRIVHTACTVFQCLNDPLAPSAIRSLLVLTSDVHSFQTRSTVLKKLHPPSVRTTKAAKSFSSQAPQAWNSLPHRITSSTSLPCFKKLIKHHFLEIERKLAEERRDLKEKGKDLLRLRNCKVLPNCDFVYFYQNSNFSIDV